MSEIEEYERVSLNAQPDIAVRGPAVNDVVHLLAELIENATSFSAAEMSVEISGQLLTSGGVLVDVTDRGVGMSAKEMAYANWQLENQSAKEINILKWMGLFVVARLAARHGIRVRLQQAEVGGLTALVWLPDDVIEYQGSAAAPRLDRFGDAGSRPDSREAAAIYPGRRDTPPGQRLKSDPDGVPAVSRPGPRPSAGMGEYAGASGQPGQVFGDEVLPGTSRREPSSQADRPMTATWSCRLQKTPNRRAGCPYSTRSSRTGSVVTARRRAGPALLPRPGAVGRHQQMKAGVPRRRSIRRPLGARRQRGSPGDPRTRI